MKQDLVLDCSITMAWCFSDESSKKADKVLEHLVTGAIAHVPSLYPLEVSNILAVGERRNRISASGITYFLDRLQKLPIETDIASSVYAYTNILSLAREYKISSYDAAYLDLAMRLGKPLATQDKQMLAAAKKADVPIFN